MDLVSIIVPIYNTEKYLKTCLDSILAQTYKNIEIILIDDGSSDSSPSICDEYKASDNRIVVLHKQNQGLINARKDGFRLAHGKYLAFVDSDDWIEAEMIESLYSLAMENDADVVISGVNDATPAGISFRRNGIAEGVYREDSLQEIKAKLFCKEEYFSLGVLPYLWNKLWKKDLLEESILNADERIRVGEDVAIGFPAILNATCMVVTDKAFYYYRQNNASMLKAEKNQQKEFTNSNLLYNYLHKYLSDVGCLDIYKDSLKRLYIHMLFTRSYELVNKKIENQGIYPYLNSVEKPIIIYGAGALGTAIYEYVSKRFEIKHWIDANADFLKQTGYPVIKLDEADIDADDIVIVAVFVKRVAESICQDLVNKGVSRDNIKMFYLSDEMEEDLLNI